MTNMRIDDNQTYEFGMLSQDAKKMGNHTEPTFSVNRYHNWPGMSLSWLGKRFRQEDRRRIKTFNDYLTINPDGYPTGRTFFFYKITVDGEERKRELVHEGMFTDPSMAAMHRNVDNGARARARQGAALADDHNAVGGNGNTVAAMQKEIIDQLTRENQHLRGEIDTTRQELTQARNQIASSQEKMLAIEGERIRFQVEKESLEQRHTLAIEALTAEHQRAIERMKEDHERALEDAREEEAASTMQALNDEMDSTKMKIQNGVGELLTNLPEYIAIGKGLMDMIKSGFGSKTAAAPQLTAQNAQAPTNANNFPSPYDERLSPQYETAEHSDGSQNGIGE